MIYLYIGFITLVILVIINVDLGWRIVERCL